MTPVSHRSRPSRAASAVLAVLLFFQTACATIPPAPTTHQGVGGWVAIVAGREAPKIEFQGFVRGKGEGAMRGAGGTFLDCLGGMGGGGCSGEFCGVVLLVLLGVCGVAGVVGGVAGAVEAPAAQRVRKDEEVARSVVAAANLQETLRQHIVAAALTGGERMVEPAAGATVSADPAALAALGADLVLEAALTEAGTRGGGGNEPVSAFMVARVRLLSAHDGTELFTREYTHLGPRHTFADWAADDGRRLRAMFESGFRILGEHIYDYTFRLYPFPERESHAAGLLAGTFGLAPIAPRTRGQLPSDDFIGNRLDWTEVPGLNPVLHWEPFPREGDVKVAPEDMARVENVRYDLVVARAENRAPAEIVYRREGLPGASHRVETALAPRTRYFWSVRARFTLDGRERVTEWAALQFAAQDRQTAPSPFSYRFRTP